jgi:hypothetical protein
MTLGGVGSTERRHVVIHTRSQNKTLRVAVSQLKHRVIDRRQSSDRVAMVLLDTRDIMLCTLGKPHVGRHRLRSTERVGVVLLLNRDALLHMLHKHLQRHTGKPLRRTTEQIGNGGRQPAAKQPAAEYSEGSTAIRTTGGHGAALNAVQTTSRNAMAAVKVTTNCSTPSFVGDPADDIDDMAVHVPVPTPAARDTTRYVTRGRNAEHNGARRLRRRQETLMYGRCVCLGNGRRNRCRISKCMFDKMQ